MDVRERESGDVERLKKLTSKERDAEQRDRYLVVSHALAGRETLWIAGGLGRSRAFVQRWVYAYRDGGIAALKDKPRGGSRPKLPRELEARLRARIDAGPTAKDKVCTLRGKDVQRIIREEFGKDISLNGAYRTLHRMGYSCLAPRPRHEKQDLAAQEKFKAQTAPLFSAPSRTRLHLMAGSVESSSWTRPGSGSRER
jgi:transposase